MTYGIKRFDTQDELDQFLTTVLGEEQVNLDPKKYGELVTEKQNHALEVLVDDFTQAMSKNAHLEIAEQTMSTRQVQIETTSLTVLVQSDLLN